MEDKRYAYAVAYIRALETGLLTAQTKRELLEAEDEESLFRVLRATIYTAGKEAIEEKLRQEHIKTISILKRLSLDTELTELLTMKYDFHNLKVLLKGKHFQQDVGFLLVEGGRLDVKELERALIEEKMRNLPDAFAEAVRKVETEFKKTGDTKTIDMVVDKEFGNVFYKCSFDYGHKFFIEFSACFSDLSNIRSFFRVRALKKGEGLLDGALLENGTLDKSLFLSFLEQPVEEFVTRLKFTDYSDVVAEGADYFREKGSLVRLEGLVDEYLLRFMEPAKYVVFGPEPLFAWAVLKDYELRSVRAIVLGKMNGVPVDMIRERVPLL